MQQGQADMVFLILAVVELIAGVYELITKKTLEKKKYDQFTEESIKKHVPIEAACMIVSAVALGIMTFSGEGRALPNWCGIAGLALLAICAVAIVWSAKKMLVKRTY